MIIISNKSYAKTNIEALREFRKRSVANNRIAPRYLDVLIGNFGSKETVLSGIRFTDDFKRDAVAQIVDRRYSVAEVSEQLGISTK